MGSARWPQKIDRVTTRGEIAAILRAVGLKPGAAVMVHSSLRGMGYLPNGPRDVFDGLMSVVGLDGTLLFPGHTPQQTDPRAWKSPQPISPDLVEKIRNGMTPFDPYRTPPFARGILVEFVAGFAARSRHPLQSVYAALRDSDWFVEAHDLNESEGEGSPIAKLYQRDGFALMLGVGLESCTALHHAEFVADVPWLYQTERTVLTVEGWTRLRKYPGPSRHFPKFEIMFERAGALRKVYLYDDYPVRLLRVRPAVDSIVQMFREGYAPPGHALPVPLAATA